MIKIKKSDITKGEGKIFPTEGGHGITVFHTASGEFFVFSTVCPHLHCNVVWRNQDKTWLCPCHGSQFEATGKLLRGPSEKNLSKLETKDWGDEIEVYYDVREMHE